jgi:hypothetical protein
MLALMLPLAALSAESPGARPPAPSPAKPGPWNVTTAPPPPAKPAEDSTLTLRLYENVQAAPLPYRPPGPGRPGPGGRGEPTWAADVSAVMTRCTDGNLVITALVIGGQLTPLDARCPDDVRGKVPAAAPACDARTWNCSTPPAR